MAEFEPNALEHADWIRKQIKAVMGEMGQPIPASFQTPKPAPVQPTPTFASPPKGGATEPAPAPAVKEAPPIPPAPAPQNPWHDLLRMGIEAPREIPTVHHGTPYQFEKFDDAKQDPNALWGPGHYFTEAPDLARSYLNKGAKAEHYQLSRPAPEAAAALHERVKGNVDLDREERALGLAAKGDRPFPFEYLPQIAEHADISDIAKQTSGSLISAKLNVQNPLDLDAPIDRKQWEKMVDYPGWKDWRKKEGLPEDKQFEDMPGGYTGAAAFDWLNQGQGQHLGIYPGESQSKRKVRDHFRGQGYDAFTHMGGKRVGDKEHRVWIPFEEQQIQIQDIQHPNAPEGDKPAHAAAQAPNVPHMKTAAKAAPPSAPWEALQKPVGSMPGVPGAWGGSDSHEWADAVREFRDTIRAFREAIAKMGKGGDSSAGPQSSGIFIPGGPTPLAGLPGYVPVPSPTMPRASSGVAAPWSGALLRTMMRGR